MEHPGGQNIHFRHLLYFAFRRGQNTTEAVRGICTVYGEDVISNRAGQRWFSKFKNGDFELEDAPRSGRPSRFDDDRLMELLKEAGHQTSQELAEKMGCCQRTIINHLRSMGYTQKVGAWVPRKLTESNKETA